MKICFIENFSETNPTPLIEELKKFGHTFVTEMTHDVDIIFCGSIVKMDTAFQYKRDYPNAYLVTYCWDYYKWAHEGKHSSFNWGKYAELLYRSSLVFVPSKGQQRRLRELIGVESVIVKTSVGVYEYKSTDEGYVLDPVRYYPEENQFWVEKACEELGIPVIHSEHKYTKEEFQKVVHGCRFMTCAYREASTGGLTLIEGLWNGKPSLVSDSPYMGAQDYLGEFGQYFRFDDFEDLKRKIKEMWDNPPNIDKKKAREYITKNFSAETMAKQINKHLCELKKK